MKLKHIEGDSLFLSMNTDDHFVLYPGDFITINHYNGLKLKFESPGYCKFVYRGGFGFDVIPLSLKPRKVNFTLTEPPTKSAL